MPSSATNAMNRTPMRRSTSAKRYPPLVVSVAPAGWSAGAPVGDPVDVGEDCCELVAVCDVLVDAGSEVWDVDCDVLVPVDAADAELVVGVAAVVAEVLEPVVVVPLAVVVPVA